MALREGSRVNPLRTFLSRHGASSTQPYERSEMGEAGQAVQNNVPVGSDSVDCAGCLEPRSRRHRVEGFTKRILKKLLV